MAPNPQRVQAPDVRRRQILDAALALATEHGFDSVSIAQVAEAAGIAKGTIYLYFASKDALAAALQADLWDQMLTEPAEIMARPDITWTVRLSEIVASWIRFEIRHHDVHHEVFSLAGHAAADPWVASRNLLRTVLDGGVDAGEFQIPDVPVTVDFLLHAYAGPCHNAHGQPVDQVVTAVQDLFSRVVGADRRGG